MKLSHKSIYGLRAMFDLAYHGDHRPMQIREIAARCRIPLRFLEQILNDLKRAGLVHSKRGPRGGYTLAHEPAAISLSMVLEALEDLPMLPAVGPLTATQGRPGEDFVADTVCAEIFAKLGHLLRETTVADLKQRGQELGLPRACYEGFVYVI